MAEERFQQEPDRSHNFKLIGVTLVALAIGAAGALWTYLILYTHTRALLPHGEDLPPELRQPEVGVVIKTLFNADKRWQDKRLARQEKLRSYGWVDRDKAIIHIPIDQAIDQYLRSGH